MYRFVAISGGDTATFRGHHWQHFPPVTPGQQPVKKQKLYLARDVRSFTLGNGRNRLVTDRSSLPPVLSHPVESECHLSAKLAGELLRANHLFDHICISHILNIK